jgi:predicted 3-demethylubiquinone-9 3-methyltransferase (glyoxalase superfamily)
VVASVVGSRRPVDTFSKSPWRRTGTIRGMTNALRTFLTFQGGAASAALDRYQDVFSDFELIDVSRYGPGEPGPEGTIQVARFRLAGSELACSDSPIDHAWGFTPAISMWVECDDDAEIERLFGSLSDGGQVYMPLGDYGFSARFGWVGDPFGVTWQLNLQSA